MFIFKYSIDRIHYFSTHMSCVPTVPIPPPATKQANLEDRERLGWLFALSLWYCVNSWGFECIDFIGKPTLALPSSHKCS